MPGVWGQAFWTRNHRYVNAMQDTNDVLLIQNRMAKVVESVTDLPCPACAEDSVYLLKEIMPLHPRHVARRGNAAYWMFQRHNLANVKKNRSILTWNQYKIMYNFNWDPEPAVADELNQAVTRYAIRLSDNKTDLPLIANFQPTPPGLFASTTSSFRHTSTSSSSSAAALLQDDDANDDGGAPSSPQKPKRRAVPAVIMLIVYVLGALLLLVLGYMLGVQRANAVSNNNKNKIKKPVPFIPIVF